jgi:hypothetical protein
LGSVYDNAVSQQQGSYNGIVRIISGAVFILIAQTVAFGYPCSVGSPLGQLSFLVGHWMGEPKRPPVVQGIPGVLQGGDFTATFELERWVLILRGGSGKDVKPVHVTEDMMIVYAACGSERGTGALYIDGTRHAVRDCTFDILFPPNRNKANGVTFVCVPEPNSPTFRLTYNEIAPGQISVELNVGQRIHKSIARRTGEH